MTIAPTAHGLRMDLAPAQLRRSLSGAPVGQHALAEASLAWQRLRPSAGTGTASQYGYLPIVETPDEEVAARVARLLSGLTFCVTTDAAANQWRVEVPASRQRPVIRALNLVWRDTLRQFGPGAPLAGADRDAAVALWRMAALLADGGPNAHLLTVGAGTPATAGLLVAAAARLGVRAHIQRVRRLPAVVVDQSDQVRLLLGALLRANAVS